MSIILLINQLQHNWIRIIALNQLRSIIGIGKSEISSIYGTGVAGDPGHSRFRRAIGKGYEGNLPGMCPLLKTPTTRGTC